MNKTNEYDVSQILRNLNRFNYFNGSSIYYFKCISVYMQF